MAFKRSLSKGDVSFDMTPASDIIFTLLLFFILTQQILPLMKVELPAVGTIQTPDQAQPVCVELTASGTIIWSGTPLPQIGWESALASHARLLPASSALVIQVDRKAPAGTAIELIDRFQAAGIRRVAFVGRTPDDSDSDERP
ncbi:MAG TPA: biopolymer transporter ExbD [Candidatus Ozemobacteraceae bacterium]|nr:biopolymer transporter ExbD [Candidatus Ozemobacteraceae bacterium]